jgi:hypothetical protein
MPGPTQQRYTLAAGRQTIGSFGLRMVLAVSVLVWLLLASIETAVSQWAGTAGLSPLVPRLFFRFAIPPIVVLHGTAAFYILARALAVSVKWSVAISLALALPWVLVIKSLAPSPSQCMMSFCDGLRARVAQVCSPVHSEIRLRAILNAHTEGSWAAGSMLPPEPLASVFHDRRPFLVLLPVGSEKPSSVQVLWRTFGGAYGVHFGREPANPGRLLDQNSHWTNSLWIIIRQE